MDWVLAFAADAAAIALIADPDSVPPGPTPDLIKIVHVMNLSYMV